MGTLAVNDWWTALEKDTAFTWRTSQENDWVWHTRPLAAQCSRNNIYNNLSTVLICIKWLLVFLILFTVAIRTMRREIVMPYCACKPSKCWTMHFSQWVIGWNLNHPVSSWNLVTKMQIELENIMETWNSPPVCFAAIVAYNIYLWVSRELHGISHPLI